MDSPVYSFAPSKLIIGLHLKFPVWFFLGPFLVLLFSRGLKEGFIAGGLSVLIFGVPFIKHGLDLAFTKCYLYEDHLEEQSGIINLSRRTIKYDKMVDVAYDQNLLDRVLGVGSMTITTSSIHHEKLAIPSVGRPKEVVKEIHKAIARHMQRYSKP